MLVLLMGVAGFFAFQVHHAGFSAPTPIQAQSWPIVLRGRDIVAVAKTGSGKTLGYLIPGFIHLKKLHNNSKVGPTVLVLAPTRELATQIQDEADKFGRSSRIACTCLYGGAPKGPQLKDIDRGVDVVVATPGRLNDILEMRRVSLRQVSYLVLDEADRMLDMGFEPQIRKIVREIPHRRQTLMFTATWPKEVRTIAADLLNNPVQVNIGGINELVANKAITQYVEVMTSIEKQRRLEQILRSQEPGSRIIIFCTTKRMCDQLSKALARRFGAVAIHGDKSQGERDRVLGHFRTGKSPILVATDVAARGLDIKDIRVVINYDFPTGVEDYVHRIGRTGRAGATGVSYTFFCDQDSKYASDLVKILEGASQHVPSELRDMVRRGGQGGKSRRWRSGRNGRSHGGRGDSSFGGKGGHGPPPSTGSDRGGRGRNDHEPRDRYDRGHEVDTRGRHDTKGKVSTSDRHRTKGRSRSRSLSPSPKGGRGGRGKSRSRSYDHVHSLSRSRSRSVIRGGAVSPARGGRSPPTKRRREASAADVHHHYDSGDLVPLPMARHNEEHRQQRSDDPGMREPDQGMREARSPNPWKERSRSPYHYMGNERREKSGSPAHWDPKMSLECHAGEAEVQQTKAGPVQSPLPDNWDEEEEGMIPADDDDDDGIIPPDADRAYSPGVTPAAAAQEEAEDLRD